jgi:hypothetical protein
MFKIQKLKRSERFHKAYEKLQMLENFEKNLGNKFSSWWIRQVLLDNISITIKMYTNDLTLDQKLEFRLLLWRWRVLLSNWKFYFNNGYFDIDPSPLTVHPVCRILLFSIN